MFIPNLKNYKHQGDFGNASCPKFNLVGPEEIDNLTLAQSIAKIQNKDLIYELIDNHSSRPGHDLRYSLDPGLLKSLGWEPKIKLTKRIEELQSHFKMHNKDNHSKTGLLRIVSERKKLLTYLKRKDLSTYEKLVKDLKIRN